MSECTCDYTYRCPMCQAIVDAEAARYRLEDLEKRLEQLENKFESLLFENEQLRKPRT